MKWKGNMAPSIEFQNGNFLVIPIDDEKDEYIETD